VGGGRRAEGDRGGWREGGRDGVLKTSVVTIYEPFLICRDVVDAAYTPESVRGLNAHGRIVRGA